MSLWELILLIVGALFELVLSSIFRLVDVALFFSQSSHYICCLLVIISAVHVYLVLSRAYRRKQNAEEKAKAQNVNPVKDSQPKATPETIGQLSNNLAQPGHSHQTGHSSQPHSTSLSQPATGHFLLSHSPQSGHTSQQGHFLPNHSPQPGHSSQPGSTSLPQPAAGHFLPSHSPQSGHTSQPGSTSLPQQQPVILQQPALAGPSSLSGTQGHPSAPSRRYCRLPGCNSVAVTVDGLLYDFDYCHIGHKNDYEDDFCLYPGCNNEKEYYGADFCCGEHLDQASDEGLGFLLNIPEDAEDFELATELFEERWRSEWNGPCPNVLAVLEVVNPAVREKFRDYCDDLEDELLDSNSWKLSKRYSRVERFFHGTVLGCQTLYQYQTPCNKQRCSVCRIIQYGFRQDCISSHKKWFGNAFYLAPNSSKSHNYCRTNCNYFAMFICWVVPGKKYKLKFNEINLEQPPDGFHSVYGQESDLGHLRNDELVIYDPDAISPKYILLYNFDDV